MKITVIKKCTIRGEKVVSGDFEVPDYKAARLIKAKLVKEYSEKVEK